MKRTHPAFVGGLAALIVPASMFLASGTAFAQGGRGAAAGESGGAVAAPPASAPAPSAPSGGGSSAGSGATSTAGSGGPSSGGHATGRGDAGSGWRSGGENPGRSHGASRGDSGRAPYSRPTSGTTPTGGTAVDRGTTGGGVNRVPPGESGNGTVRNPDVPPYSRSRDGQPTEGTAVPRTTPPPAHGGGVPSGIFLPWGFGGLGMYGVYDPYYDPWDGGGYGGYDPPPPSYSSYAEGAIKLKVKPNNASVFVDGYFVGVVDDFDGFFQRLHVASGPHRIEISAPGYETLSFDIRVPEDETVTYKGELRKLP